MSTRSNLFPNAVLLIRDPTHFVRTAVKTPMEHTGHFAKQHAELLGKKHALLKDLQHSRLWQARLEACQNALAKLPSCSAGGSQPIKHILARYCHVITTFWPRYCHVRAPFLPR